MPESGALIAVLLYILVYAIYGSHAPNAFALRHQQLVG